HRPGSMRPMTRSESKSGDRRGRQRSERGSSGQGPARANRGNAAPGRGGKNLPRRIAWEVLVDVATKDAYANLLLPAKLTRVHMNAQDAAFTTELTYGALRRDRKSTRL